MENTQAMKRKTILLLAILLTGCVTTTEPDGTVTKSPDHTFWSGVANAANNIIAAKYAPKAEPVILPTK
jgi:PBP1b-binding outer membrane lipoprotein LpoB